jgi:hypothetical protein
MALPTLESPVYELTVPSLKKKIKYRPFTVKEEKVLLMALESEDNTQIADAIRGIIESCVLKSGNKRPFKIDELATFDIEYIFLNIRARSVGEIIELILTCPDDMETDIKVSINIEDIEVQFDEEHENTIQLTDDLWIEMGYPGLDSFTTDETIDDTFSLIGKSIKRIYNEEDVWDRSTAKDDEFISFVETMNSKQFAKVQKFFDTLPSLKHTVKAKNPKTQYEFEYTIEGLSSFFA